MATEALERPAPARTAEDRSADAARLAAVPLRVTDPERIPSKRYYDQAFFDLEREKLWPHVWQMAARLEEIPDVGDYVEYRLLDKSVIVVRTKSGVKAFHNACRHRGVQLVTGSGNCKTKGFICPFHHRLIDGYLAELDPEKLAHAQTVVNSGFESPILDIGL